MAKARKQAFKQAPWRVRVRSLGGTLLWVVALLAIGGMYLAVSSRVARAGRVVIEHEARKERLILANTELTAELAALTAPERMLSLARGMGFRPARASEIEYVVVEGYVPPEPFVAPRPMSSITDRAAALSPAYTETLGEWMMQFFRGGAD